MASSSYDQRQPRRFANQTNGGARVNHVLDFKDPKVFSKKMAEINNMNKLELVDALTRLNVRKTNPSMAYRVLQRHLKDYYRRQRAYAAADVQRTAGPGRFPSAKFYDFFIVVDFECTCEDGIYEYEHEIIEFPAVLIDVNKMQIIDEFRSFVRPTLRPVLSEFAMALTGVTQDVDAAPPFLDVLEIFRRWCRSHELGIAKTYAIVTDGPWDMGKFFQMQCIFSGLDYVPHEYRHYVNLRRSFSAFYPTSKQGYVKPNTNQNPTQSGGGGGETAAGDRTQMMKNSRNVPSDWRNLAGMLDFLGMKFEGREHCGLDDARNIARIVIEMLKCGAELRVNERLMRRDRADRLLQQRRQFREEREAKEQPLGARSNRTEMLADALTNITLNKEKPTTPEARNSNSPTGALPLAERTDLTQEDKERQFWREHLPYKTVTVTKRDFIMELYDECETCGEHTDNEDNQ